MVNPASTVSRAWATPSSASWAAEVVVAGTPAVWTSPMRWLWVSMRPGRTVRPPRSRPRAPSGTPSSGPAIAVDAAVADEDGPLADQRTGFDVEQAPDADGDRAIGIGEGGCRHPRHASRVRWRP